MSGQFDLESDTLSSGFSDGSENKFCSRETQNEPSPDSRIEHVQDRRTESTQNNRTESARDIRTDQDHRSMCAQDKGSEEEPRGKCSNYDPEYKAIFRYRTVIYVQT